VRKTISKRIFGRRFRCAAVLCSLLVAFCSGEGPLPGRRKATTDQTLALDAMKLKKKLGDEFIVEVQEPFIIVGNISRAEFDRIQRNTILSAYRSFYRQFFTVRPNRPIRIFLFKDDRTYRKHAGTLFGDKPTTPFGYYHQETNSLVMNIATGTGTLVHEMTHAFTQADFPQIPAWFNEGLGSLYEQCRITPDGLKGLVNWRLPILRRAIREKKLAGLPRLISTTRSQFYADPQGTHYAEARYFCMYMQELGLLENFYRSFKANVKRDPTGAKTVEQVLGKSLPRIQESWLRWVNTLPDYR
jgi:hypothetical protein